jgi:hypothetical protein
MAKAAVSQLAGDQILDRVEWTTRTTGGWGHKAQCKAEQQIWDRPRANYRKADPHPRTDLEAIRLVKEIFDISTPTASGFSLRRLDGMEIYRWFRAEAEIVRERQSG